MHSRNVEVEGWGEGEAGKFTQVPGLEPMIRNEGRPASGNRWEVGGWHQSPAAVTLSLVCELPPAPAPAAQVLPAPGRAVGVWVPVASLNFFCSTSLCKDGLIQTWSVDRA